MKVIITVIIIIITLELLPFESTTTITIWCWKSEVNKMIQSKASLQLQRNERSKIIWSNHQYNKHTLKLFAIFTSFKALLLKNIFSWDDKVGN